MESSQWLRRPISTRCSWLADSLRLGRKHCSDVPCRTRRRGATTLTTTSTILRSTIGSTMLRTLRGRGRTPRAPRVSAERLSVWSGAYASPSLSVSARVAQSAEHLSCKQDVEGSIPSSGSHQAITPFAASVLMASSVMPNSARTASVSQPGYA